MDGVGCHGVSFHARTDAGTLVLGLINAGTLTGTNAYDCVRDNTEHAVAHFSSKAILTLTINKLSLVSGVWVDDNDPVNEPSSLILNVLIIAAKQWGSVND